ncbi:hypothetical protein PP348_20290 [Mycobacteroides abscessus]|uniref:hypothetical protein n=1 Tax=Mycobacteroides abscessus TaxID=36809 RepID=UPI002104F96B|nr:hypothetical protein [Mycobacteroides abscessus]MDM2096416.1 hypothetical protein [Mycobacteroides abscessus]MDM2121147.1 hypothetical protein [Mycobacteroides abscessus]MDM2124358.1 hypothetical protein [Mycobacteroides abscessus]MDM2130543.1 hypothetical protein [Mycobacteroides abscessus]MDM2203068.1 hypothetical protein [Mycobacteroides abscessus]
MASLLPIARPRRSSRPAGRAAARLTEGVRLIPIETASATARPDAIEKTYLELAHDALALEQQHLFAAEGEVRARNDAGTATSLAYAADHLKASVELAKSAADRAAARYQQTCDVLGPYVRRRATSSWGYVARTAALLLGDIAGLSGAAIALGEYPALAVTQAISAGTATVTAGLAATQLRHMQHAAERQLDELPKPLESYRHLFGGTSNANRVQAAVFVVAALIAVLVAVGIFALRTTIEGPLSGITFGALAAAIALASFINSWYHADAVADVIESAHHDAVQADRRHRHLATSHRVRNAEHAASQAKSVVTEYTHRGLAAAAHVEADKYRALLASPDVVGHGPAPGPAQPAPSIKRARLA